MPDLSMYFYAVQIKHLMTWMSETEKTKWKVTEMSSVQSLDTVILGRNKGKNSGINNYCITNTVETWRIVKLMNITENEMFYLKEI